MIAAVSEFANRFLGRGDAAITVPSFDGALKPNQLIETAEILLACDAPEDLAVDGQSLLVADGNRLLRMTGSSPTVVRSFERPISALAVLPAGRLAVALGGTEVHVYDDIAAKAPSSVFTGDLHAINALAPAPDGALITTDGSTLRGVRDWARDLMELGDTGRVFRLDPKTGLVKQLASGLHYAFGAVASGSDVLVSESWRHRLVAIAPDGARKIVLGRLPVYPSRLAAASGGGFWLTAFIARTQLVEFVLREPAFRRRMIAEIEPDYWVVPRLSSGHSFKEPLQGAHIKTMGIMKPWAPPRSYGLVIRLGADGSPRYSLHSRADGVNHGIVAAVELGGDLVMIAKGPGRILKLPLASLDEGIGA
ncbi:SMP-30/gluconolactonase/LRE family protein [Bradyrhizobium sp. STM 3557]|uniref:SMP-30/gluconolactonase/LRE family protein n=1 Tax=Bradyrhizobium sp. STM 3557 TaxID=578920 RepID=UPI00388D7759